LGTAEFIAAGITPTAQRSMQITFTVLVFLAETVVFAKDGSEFTNWQGMNQTAVSLGGIPSTVLRISSAASCPMPS
jgi:polar amino acid transport system substrate-binding protein